MTESLGLSAGDNKTLLCSFVDSCNSQQLYDCPEVSYSWSFNGESIEDLPQFQSGFFRNSHGESEFPLQGVTSAHSGTYMCRVDTSAGHVSKSVSVTINSVPLSPVGVRVHSPTRNSVMISWHLPLDAGGAYEGDLDAYRIEALAGNGSRWRVVSQSKYIFITSTVSGFKPGCIKHKRAKLCHS